jgi:hypothetical protein
LYHTADPELDFQQKDYNLEAPNDPKDQIFQREKETDNNNNRNHYLSITN